MRRLAIVLMFCAALSACLATRPTKLSKTALEGAATWERRAAQLQQAGTWTLEGRVAVAVGTEGWQASLSWREQNAAAEVHLAGPLGVGALILKETPQGLSLNGAPPSDAVVAQVQQRLGFELPLGHLRYWLVGVPDPGSAFDLTRNEQDRAQRLTQAGWSIVYDRYLAVNGDWLPAQVVLRRDGDAEGVSKGAAPAGGALRGAGTDAAADGLIAGGGAAGVGGVRVRIVVDRWEAPH